VKPHSTIKRVLGWFWLGAALAEKRRVLPQPSARVILLGRRAQGCADLASGSAELARGAELARSAMAHAETGETVATACSCELYRQSLYWALCALASYSDESAGTSYRELIWDTLDERLLLDAVGQARVEPLRGALRHGSFVTFAELSRVEQQLLCAELRKLSESLLAKVNERKLAVKAIVRQRMRRLSLLLLLAFVAAGAWVWERKTRDDRRDLAEGKPWRASSKLDGGGCSSPEQACPDSPGFFFHTTEEKNPWVEFDLGRVQEISAVQTENRKDCCFERSFPLVVEVSENHKHWRSVARQDANFTTWRANFSPVHARWVRLRSPKQTYLHLARVRILP
jgi:hypothetical protein